MPWCIDGSTGAACQHAEARAVLHPQCSAGTGWGKSRYIVENPSSAELEALLSYLEVPALKEASVGPVKVVATVGCKHL